MYIHKYKLYTFRWLLQEMLNQLSTVDMQEYSFESSAETPAAKQMKNYPVPKHSKNCLLSYQITAQINPTLNKGKEEIQILTEIARKFCSAFVRSGIRLRVAVNTWRHSPWKTGSNCHST